MTTFAKWFHLSVGASATLLTGCWADEQVQPEPPTLAEGEHVIDRDLPSLELQRTSGWRVGAEHEALSMPETPGVDVTGGTDWQLMETSLPAVLAPTNPVHAPFYVPTLFQSLQGPTAADLRALVLPIHTSEMLDTEHKATALRSMLAQAGWPKDLAVFLDLPGPESVGVATELADRLDPVFTFGNWPHPHGVVPAHYTLGAALYYAPRLEELRAERARDAPPLFVLDAWRLTDYSDEDDVFDNRYAARLPTLSALQRLGITRVLYVNDGKETELDDLNEAFVELRRNGIEVRMVSLSDVSASDLPPSAEEQADMPLETWGRADDRYWYWAGSALNQLGFWSSSGWPYGCQHPHHRLDPTLLAAGALSSAQAYVPEPRRTIFGAMGHSTAPWQTVPRPGGFGAMAVRTSRASGHVVAMGPSGRSGSFGRGGGSHGG